jgi:hypothetical protein
LFTRHVFAKSRLGRPQTEQLVTHDAEVAIVRPAGAWFHCMATRLGDVGAVQIWSYLSAEQIAHLITRIASVAGQPVGCICPDCRRP